MAKLYLENLTKQLNENKDDSSIQNNVDSVSDTESEKSILINENIKFNAIKNDHEYNKSIKNNENNKLNRKVTQNSSKRINTKDTIQEKAPEDGNNLDITGSINIKENNN